MGVSIRGGRDQLVVEVAANERHERAAGRMNPANRQPSGNLGNLWVIAAQNSKLQLVRGFNREAGVLCPNRAPFGLPWLSMPNRTTGDVVAVLDASQLRS